MGIVFLLMVVVLTYEQNERSNQIKIKGEGFSMMPTYGFNEVLTLNPVKDEYNIGDVIAVDISSKKFKVDNETFKGNKVIHRIVDIGKDNKGVYYLIKGDAYDYLDGIYSNGKYYAIKIRNNDIIGVIK